MNQTFKHLIRTVTFISSLGVLAGLANAQEVRGLGMGGALLPGPSLAQYNPAYTGYNASGFQPDGLDGGIPLPLGLINFFVRPSMNPFTLYSNLTNKNAAALTDPNTAFDALAFIDQVYNINTFIINPPSAPKRLNINYGGDGAISLTDENGKPLELNSYSGSSGGSSNGVGASNFTPNFRFGNLELGVGIFADVQGPTFSTDQALSAALSGTPLSTGTPYGFTANVKGSAGISLGLAFATGIPISSPETGDLTIYVGGRARGFYGLALADVKVKGDVTIDAVSNQPVTSYTTTSFVSLIGKGYGFGINGDIGVAVDVPLGSDKSTATFGIGAVNLVNYTTWSGEESVSRSGVADTVTTPASRTDAIFNPLFTLNAGYSFRVEEISSRIFVAADVQFGQGRFSTTLGLKRNSDRFMLEVESGMTVA